MVRAAHERSNQFYAGCIAWFACCWWLVKNDLGSIAFVASVLLAIWFLGLRDKFESDETLSAYSVFNRGGQAILGGFTGEQLDGQLRGGMPQKSSSDPTSSATGDAPLATTTKRGPATVLNEDEKLRRRSAAAAAAELRVKQQAELRLKQQQQQQQQS